ncbi:MAG: hypothetical protein JW913_16765 [Chitinispirillaceae bacterium]|nr:hypothetical protein [Chitinispirillaceae bacterium]
MTEPTRPPQGGTDHGRAPLQPIPDTACTCPQCRLTRILAEMVGIAQDAPPEIADRLGEICVELSSLILG